MLIGSYHVKNIEILVSTCVEACLLGPTKGNRVCQAVSYLDGSCLCSTKITQLCAVSCRICVLLFFIVSCRFILKHDQKTQIATPQLQETQKVDCSQTQKVDCSHLLCVCVELSPHCSSSSPSSFSSIALSHIKFSSFS